MKNFKDLEKIIKGFFNHRRIEILTLLAKHPNILIFDIGDIFDLNFKTIINT